MYCRNCGAIIEENAETCPQCNASVMNIGTTEKPITEEVPVKKCSTKGIVGFVLSLVGIVFAAIPCGIIGLVFSSIALNECNEGKYAGKGFALSGLIISIIDVITGIIILANLF